MSEPTDRLHKNDIYGNIDGAKDAEVAPAIPAATVVLLRDEDAGPEVLMLHKNSKIAFGGMWVFPGGRIDDEDYQTPDRDLEAAARVAAARETVEEAGIQAAPTDFVWFAHWTPPPSTPKRFATWFFATRTDIREPVSIDGGEILDHDWVSPTQALARHTAGEIDLAPPTWITLYHLSRYSTAAHILDVFRSREPKFYETHVAKRSDGIRVAMWSGDAGYEPFDADADGHRHRLVMSPGGFEFENTVEHY